MKQVKNPAKKAKTPKTDIRIHRRIMEQDFLKKIAKDPDYVFTDFDIKYAVLILRNWCRSGDEGLKNKGIRILKKAGLTSYIPKTSRGYLKVYTENPGLLLAEVKERAIILKEVLPKRAKSRREKLDAIRSFLGLENSRRSIGRHFPTKSLKDRTNIALAWIAYRNGASYARASNLYQKIKKNSSKVDTPSYLDDYKKAYNDYFITEQIRPSIASVQMKFTKVNKTGTVLETTYL